MHIDSKPKGLADHCLGPLTRALQLPDPQVRSEAAEALGLLGPAAGLAVPALKELAQDPEESVRKSVAAALKKIVR